MKKQTSNLKELTAIYLALCHFVPLIKKSRYNSIHIRIDNTAAIYHINKKSGVMIWKLSEINCLQLKAAHIPGRINVATNRLSKLEIMEDYTVINKKININIPICIFSSGVH
jgi:hypothetical protein